MFSCSVCVKTFSRKDSLKRHINNFHKQCGFVQCSVCDHLMRKDDLVRHMKVHGGSAEKRTRNTINIEESASSSSSRKRRLHQGRTLIFKNKDSVIYILIVVFITTELEAQPSADGGDSRVEDKTTIRYCDFCKSTIKVDQWKSHTRSINHQRMVIITSDNNDMESLYVSK